MLMPLSPAIATLPFYFLSDAIAPFIFIAAFSPFSPLLSLMPMRAAAADIFLRLLIDGLMPLIRHCHTDD